MSPGWARRVARIRWRGEAFQQFVQDGEKEFWSRITDDPAYFASRFDQYERRRHRDGGVEMDVLKRWVGQLTPAERGNQPLGGFGIDSADLAVPVVTEWTAGAFVHDKFGGLGSLGGHGYQDERRCEACQAQSGSKHDEERQQGVAAR